MFYMHPVIFNAQNKFMTEKLKEHMNLSQSFEDYILFRHQLGHKCMKWNQNCSDRR